MSRPDLAPEDCLRAPPGDLGERQRERVVRELRCAAGREEPALPAAEARLVPEEELDQDRHARLFPDAEGGLTEVARLQRLRDAENRVRWVRLVAVLRQPERLGAEVARDLAPDLRQARHREAGRTRSAERRLAAAGRIGVLGVRVEAGVRRPHPLHEEARRHPGRRPPRRGHTAGDLVRAGDRLQRRIRGVERALHVEARRHGDRERAAVRLVPHRPETDPGKAPCRGRREAPETGARQAARRAAAVRPARRAPERHEHRDAACVQLVEDVPVGAPAIPRVGGVPLRSRLPRRDRVPAQGEADDAGAETLERRHPLAQRPRPVHEPGVVLDAVAGAVRGGRRRRSDARERAQDDEGCSDPPAHVEDRSCPLMTNV